MNDDAFFLVIFFLSVAVSGLASSDSPLYLGTVAANAAASANPVATVSRPPPISRQDQLPR